MEEYDSKIKMLAKNSSSSLVATKFAKVAIREDELFFLSLLKCGEKKVPSEDGIVWVMRKNERE